MFSRVPERNMRLVRGALAIGFLVLIGSLFWDPMSADLTQLDSLASPFHLSGQIVTVQGHGVAQAPYRMTNRIWWTMLIPVLPLFFMVAGHETWRRICPLSFISQIPRYLGWNRTRALLSRKSGQVERQLALVAKGGFWQRHVWEIQFGLFFLALNGRILFLNANRLALGLFLLATITLAFVTGLLWGGKSWCNYICPVAIVQKIYTAPRGGLFESQAHRSADGLTQSICRTSTPAGDRGACVGCTVNCPDIDLERSYWENLSNPNLPYIYYGFFGLIVGFYGWYYLYAGNWGYYFSGAWTHDPDQFGKLLQPGLMLAGHIIAIPVIVSTPLILGVAVGVAMLVGKLCERIYRRAVTGTRRGLSAREITNRCLTFSAYLSINTFYLFGGRPNLMLLPVPALHAVDMLITALTTIWFWRAVQRSPSRYRREGLAARLLEELRKLPVEIGRFLEGRKLDDLSTDEVYILAKTLPPFSRDQRMRAYRNILRDAVQKGSVDALSSLALLRDMRLETGVTDDEHREALQALELDGTLGAPEESAQPATIEDWFRVESYQGWLEPLLVARFGPGQSLSRILEEIGVAESIAEYRAIYQISDTEHAAVVGALTGGGNPPIAQQTEVLLGLLADSARLILGLHRKILSADAATSLIDWPPIGALLIAGVRHRAAALCRKLFAILIAVGDSAPGRAMAVRIARLSGADIETALSRPVADGVQTTWGQSLPAPLLDLLRGAHPADDRSDTWPHASNSNGTLHPLTGAAGDLAASLCRLVGGADPLLGALALAALSDIDLPRARACVADLTSSGADLSNGTAAGHGLMAEVVAALDGQVIPPASRADNAGLTLIVLSQSEAQPPRSFNQDRVSIGGSPDNDVVIAGLAVAPHHAVICRSGLAVEVRRADPTAAFTIDGTGFAGDRTVIQSGARLGLLTDGVLGPVVVIEWAPNAADITLEPRSTLRKLLWLSQADIFRDVGLHALAELAGLARAWHCGRGTWLCRQGDASGELFVLATGTADVFVRHEGREQPTGQLRPGALVDDIGLITGAPHSVSVCISSATAHVVTINALRLRALMERDAGLSLAMLGAVATASPPEDGPPMMQLAEHA